MQSQGTRTTYIALFVTMMACLVIGTAIAFAGARKTHADGAGITATIHRHIITETGVLLHMEDVVADHAELPKMAADLLSEKGLKERKQELPVKDRMLHATILEQQTDTVLADVFVTKDEQVVVRTFDNGTLAKTQWFDVTDQKTAKTWTELIRKNLGSETETQNIQERTAVLEV